MCLCSSRNRKKKIFKKIKIKQLPEHGPVTVVWKVTRDLCSLVLIRTGDSNQGQVVWLWSGIPENTWYNLLSVFSDLFLKHHMWKSAKRELLYN